MPITCNCFASFFSAVTMSKQIVAVLFEPIINEMKNFRFPRRSTRNEPKSKPSFPTREEVSSRRTLTQRHYYASLMMRPDTCNKIIMPVQQEMLRRLIDSKKKCFCVSAFKSCPSFLFARAICYTTKHFFK